MAIEELEWGREGGEAIQGKYSLLLGADLVYTEANVEPLISAVQAVIRKNKCCEILLAHSSRNSDVDCQLFVGLTSLGFDLQAVGNSQRDRRVTVYQHLACSD